VFSEYQPHAQLVAVALDEIARNRARSSHEPFRCAGLTALSATDWALRFGEVLHEYARKVLHGTGVAERSPAEQFSAMLTAWNRDRVCFLPGRKPVTGQHLAMASHWTMTENGDMQVFAIWSAPSTERLREIDGQVELECLNADMRMAVRSDQVESRRTPALIKVLLLSANPIDSPLNIDEESRAIDQKIRSSEHRDHVDLIKHGAVRLKDIPGLLMRHKPHIVHFSGHGDAGAIELTHADGSSHLVAPESLADIFRVLKDNVRVVVLNACNSEPQAQAIVSVIDCAVGMSEEIKDDAAIAFAATFYEALGYGRSVQDAFDLALVQVTATGAERSLAKMHTRPGVKPADIVLVNPQRPR
jgi:hypothetical protein